MGQATEGGGGPTEQLEKKSSAEAQRDEGRPGQRDGRGRRVLALGLADGLKAALEEGDEEAARIALEGLVRLLGRG